MFVYVQHTNLQVCMLHSHKHSCLCMCTNIERHWAGWPLLGQNNHSIFAVICVELIRINFASLYQQAVLPKLALPRFPRGQPIREPSQPQASWSYGLVYHDLILLEQIFMSLIFMGIKGTHKILYNEIIMITVSLLLCEYYKHVHGRPVLNIQTKAPWLRAFMTIDLCNNNPDQILWQYNYSLIKLLNRWTFALYSL